MTAPVAALNNTLFDSSSDSRETRSKRPANPTVPARQPKSASEPPTTRNRKPRMKTPRAGSVAKACTLVSTPERTRNVPSRLKENAAMASSTVQALKAPRFSATASECSNAVPANQGMNRPTRA